MFIETQNGDSINLDMIESLEVIENSLYAFTPAEDCLLIGDYLNKDEAREVLKQINHAMQVHDLLIPYKKSFSDEYMEKNKNNISSLFRKFGDDGKAFV